MRTYKTIPSVILLASFLLAGGLSSIAPVSLAEGESPVLLIAPFYAEITPPMGHPLCGGWIAPAMGVDHPELAKGVVLQSGDQRYVLCSMDWCQVRNDTYDMLRERIALAARTSPHQVAVHTVHQHDALIVDAGAQRLLDSFPDTFGVAVPRPYEQGNSNPPPPNTPLHADYDFLDQVAGDIAAAVDLAVARLEPVTHVGTGMAKVDRVAATRRVIQEDGSVLVRWSKSTDPVLQEAPEGNIDPFIRTVSFYNQDRPLVRMHYYATHPQSYYGDGRTTYDFPGIARERIEKESGVFQIYFTGCAGDVTAGKYNDGSEEARYALADRLYHGMAASSSSTQVHPATAIVWKIVQVPFELREEESFRPEKLQEVVASPDSAPTERLRAALALNWTRRVLAGHAIEFSCLSLGPVRILHLPGEPMIEFQHEAQRVGGEGRFVAVAGYGDSGTGYVCTEEAYAQGGYEPTASLLHPKSEARVKKAIAELLAE